MKKFFFAFLLIFLVFPIKANAIYDPLSFANNKFGIHILFPDELSKAKDLVNSNGGDWGYVIIPIQAGDKDLVKWQKFMDDAKSLHLIPILRLATEGDYFQKESWRKPQETDIIDFANFLDSLSWPVKNRYVVIFNEVNRSDEWEGEANPSEYSKLLSYAVTVFKSKNSDYFIISSGMDNASITRNNTFSEYDYFRKMNQEVPGIFNQIDGFASHSYPNPGFSQPPNVNTSRSIYSFLSEKELISELSSKKLPIFITETGWDQAAVGESNTGNYFKEAFESVWNDPNIIAVTPFLLKAGPGPFEKFSFIKNNGEKSDAFKMLESIAKVKGNPTLNNQQKVLGSEEQDTDLPIKNFSDNTSSSTEKNMKFFVKWLLFPI